MERLSSSDNILRKKDSCLPDVPDQEIVDVPEVEEDAEEGPELVDTPGPRSILKHLDGLLQPGKPGHHPNASRYKGHIDAQVAIGETELILGAAHAAPLFGLQDQQTARYGDGTTNVLRPNPVVKKRIEESKERIAQLAADRLQSTLDCLTPVKLSSIKRATNLSKVGKDMATILEKVTPKGGAGEEHVHFHIFRPEQMQVNNYQVVNLGGAVPAISGGAAGGSVGSVSVEGDK